MSRIAPVLPAPRPMSARAVLAILLRAGPISRAEIARTTGLSKQTISDVMRELEGAGWVRETGQVQGALGRSALTYEIRGRAALALGIDLGGTKLLVALADLSGAILAEIEEATDRRGGRHVVDQIGRLGDGLVAEAGVPPGAVRFAVMGSPGIVDPRSGAIAIAPNIPGLEAMDVRQALRDRLHVEVAIENDVNLAAMGERRRGGRGELRTFVFVAIGTGIGMGLVADGRLVRGFRGAAGEIAYLPLGGDPYDPRGFAYGTLETAIRAAAIADRYAALGGRADATVRDVFSALQEGDEAARATIAETGRIVAVAVRAVASVIDPELVVFGGGIGARPELLAEVDRHLALCMPDPVPTAISALGRRATLIGAIGTAVERLHGLVIGLEPGSGQAPSPAGAAVAA